MRHTPYIIMVIVFCSCKTQEIIKSTSTIKKQDSIIFSRLSYKYLNPFNTYLDTTETFNHNGDIETALVLSRISLKNGNGRYECFVHDTVKFLTCDVSKNKINGNCIKYFLPDGKDVMETGYFKNNKLDGEYKRFGANKTLLFNRKYKKGILISN